MQTNLFLLYSCLLSWVVVSHQPSSDLKATIKYVKLIITNLKTIIYIYIYIYNQHFLQCLSTLSQICICFFLVWLWSVQGDLLTEGSWNVSSTRQNATVTANPLFFRRRLLLPQGMSPPSPPFSIAVVMSLDRLLPPPVEINTRHDRSPSMRWSQATLSRAGTTQQHRMNKLRWRITADSIISTRWLIRLFRNRFG